MSTLRVVRRDQYEALHSIDPATGQAIQSYPQLSAEEIERRIALAAKAFASYRRKSFAERSAVLHRAAEILESEEDRWADLMSREMGKLRKAAIEEARKCARCCRFYAEKSAAFLAEEVVETSGDRTFIAFEPLGPVLAIMPWNFPFWQVFRSVAPALMAGNSILLKHASNVPGCALAIEELFARAGLPEGVFQSLLIGSSRVRSILEDGRVRAVTLTGSDAAGARVASAAGHNLKKAVLELGGSDPFIVMPSADLDRTVAMAVGARIVNNGESCVAAKRFILHERIAGEFERRFVAAMEALKVGDPADPETEVGPLATAAVLETLERQVDATVRAGARVLTGARRLPGPGYFYSPTALGSIPPAAPARREEVFGPVALLFRATSLEEAIRIANDSPYGLGSSLWSSDPAEQETFVRDIEAGMAFVNAQVVSDPRLPFGGVKRSGYGRELGILGIREFVNVKTVWIGKSA